MISSVFAVIKAIPILNEWFQKLFAYYMEKEIENMKAEIRDSIKYAIANHDQIKLERSIGSTKAGEHSGINGTERRKNLPGVNGIFLFIASVSLFGCLSKQEIEATIWLNNGLPVGICEKNPELYDFGFYRKLDDGDLEFISFCDPRSKEWFGIYKDDLNRILQTLPDRRRRN